MAAPVPQQNRAVPKRRPSGAVLTLVPELPPEGAPRPRPVRSRLGRIFKWSVIVGIVAAFLVGTGVAVYRQVQDKAARRQARRAARIARLDTPAAYRRALGVLDRLRAQRPTDPWVAVARADILAQLWGRYVGDDALRQASLDALRVAERGVRKGGSDLLRGALEARGDSLATRVDAVRAEQLLFLGEAEKAIRVAEAARLEHPRSARLATVVGVARAHLGDLAAAEAILRLASSTRTPYVPALVTLARVQRLRGRLRAADQSLRAAQAVSREHLLLRTEKTLLRQARGERVAWRILRQNERDAAPYPPVQARARLALATGAWQRGDRAMARRLLEQAALSLPHDQEIGLALAAAYLGPGGDAQKAWSLRGRIQDRSQEIAMAPLVWARIALDVGRPEDALRWIARVGRGLLPDALRGRLARLEVEAAGATDDSVSARRLCARLWEGSPPMVRQGADGSDGADGSETPPWLVPGPRLGAPRGRPRARAAEAQGTEGGLEGAEAAPAGLSAGTVEACLWLAAKRRDRRGLRRASKRLSGRFASMARALEDLARYRVSRAAEALASLARGPHPPPWVWVALSDAFTLAGRPRRGVPMLRRAVRLSGGAVAARVELARGLLRAGLRKEAGERFDALARSEITSAWALRKLGRLGVKLGRRRAVQGLAKRMERRWPSSPEVAFLRGELARQGHHAGRAARQWYEAALLRDPEHVEAALALGRLALERGDRVAARARFDAAMRPRARRPEVALAIARAYSAAGWVRRARHAYVKAALLYRLLGARRAAADVLAELGDRLVHVKRYRRRSVERVLKWALHLSDRSPRAHLRMGQLLEAQGRWRDALRHLRRAVSLGPELPEAFYALGALLMSRRRLVMKAEPTLRRFLQLTASGTGRRARNARAWIARIEALRRVRERSPKRRRAHRRTHRRSPSG